MYNTSTLSINDLELLILNLKSDVETRGGGGQKVLSCEKLDESLPSEKLHKIDHPKRLVCSDWRCLWSGLENEALQASNPFNAGCILLACPNCKQQSLCTRCDEPECLCEATCGTPTTSGYRLTCWRHKPISSSQSENIPKSHPLTNPRLAKALDWCHKKKLERDKLRVAVKGRK